MGLNGGKLVDSESKAKYTVLPHTSYASEYTKPSIPALSTPQETGLPKAEGGVNFAGSSTSASTSSNQ